MYKEFPVEEEIPVPHPHYVDAGRGAEPVLMHTPSIDKEICYEIAGQVVNLYGCRAVQRMVNV